LTDPGTSTPTCLPPRKFAEDRSSSFRDLFAPSDRLKKEERIGKKVTAALHKPRLNTVHCTQYDTKTTDYVPESPA